MEGVLLYSPRNKTTSVTGYGKPLIWIRNVMDFFTWISQWMIHIYFIFFVTWYHTIHSCIYMHRYQFVIFSAYITSCKCPHPGNDVMQSLLLTWINFNLSMDKLITSIIMCGMKLLIHSQTSTVPPLRFGNGYVISSGTLQAIWLLIHACR